MPEKWPVLRVGPAGPCPGPAPRAAHSPARTVGQGGRSDVPERRRDQEVHRGQRRQIHRRPLLRPARHHAARHAPGRGVRPGRAADVRRFVDPRLPGHPRVRHGACPGPVHLARGPVPQGQDDQHQLLHPGPITGEAYSRDPRNVAKKAEAYLASSGIADTAYFGPEAEFYVFDDVRFETRSNAGYYYIDSEAGAGTPAPSRRAATGATRSATRAATSPPRRSTTSPTCARRSPWS